MKELSPALTAIVCLIAVAAIALPMAAVRFYVARPNIPKLQRLAEKSCNCARKTAGSGAKACWSDFEKQAAENGFGQEFAYACAGLTPRKRCTESGTCVTLGYGARYIPYVGEDAFCSPTEFSEAETLYGQISATRNDEIAGRALKELSLRFANGRQAAGSAKSSGCGG
ncbi:MAG: hypothetical protein KF730_15705 [Sphingomonas sp.]|uniref:hypothetical protein n=1 Tax=Sphingomonas sp. TaxID=28214 RepID=UPI0025FF19C3|nr:hypothetical protein [Sphingomonas sp.]MBX3566011.1 hypothetical protein [Sphingomonas sp.]